MTLDTLAEDVNFVKYLYFGQLSDNLHDPHDNLEITYMIRVFFQILALSAFTQTVLIKQEQQHLDFAFSTFYIIKEASSSKSMFYNFILYARTLFSL